MAKIYEWIKIFYKNNDEIQTIKWLEVLNHDNFPIDTDLIRNIGLGNFINQQIRTKWKNLSALISKLEQKWYQFAKHEKEMFSKRNAMKKIFIPEAHLCRTQIVFKRNDKPSQIQNICKQKKNKSKPIQIRSILMTKKRDANYTEIEATNHDQTHLMMHSDDNDNEYTLEYIGIDDEENDVSMEENEDDETSEDFNMDLLQNRKDDEMKNEVVWYKPLRLDVDHGLNVIKTPGMIEEEKRIKHIKEEHGAHCVELESSLEVSNDLNNNMIVMLTDYPHWSEIEKYRKENDVY